MRYFIFTILLVVPLLLTAQSKKEQIATLNLRVDSLFEVLLNNAQKLSDQRGEIFQLSQEKIVLELKSENTRQEKLSLETEMSFKNSSLDTMQVQLQLAQDEINALHSSLNLRAQNVIEMLLKYDSFNYDIDEEIGYASESCTISFYGVAEGDWYENWSFNCLDKNVHSLIPGEIYVVSICLVDNDAGYTSFGFCNARLATPKEIESQGIGH